jgi:hypothetical protein
MKYMLLMYSDEATAAKFTPEEQQAVVKEWYDYMGQAKAAGVLLDNNGLSPASDATVVRVRNGKTLTTDGPFAETHEQMGGYSVLECKDLDEAVRWAARIPTARFGFIEVRPLWSPNS